MRHFVLIFYKNKNIRNNMLPSLSSPNILLSLISDFLNNDESSLEKINSLISNSPTSDLVPSFSFLSRWISERLPLGPDGPNSSENSCHENNKHLNKIRSMKKMQAALSMLGKISLKVPPVILLNGIYDLNWGMYHPHWQLFDFYTTINQRIHRLRSYLKPYSSYGHIAMFPPTFHSANEFTDKNIYGLVVEMETDPSYQTALLYYFKRLILNYSPLCAFKPLIEHRNSRSILTKAIIELIQSLNEARDATHEQLVFGFSSIFLYIHAFTLSNEIDGQALCEFLQSRPYLSPFCLLAMINHIPVNLYLFNLLTPKELALSIEQPSELKPSQYNMVDLSNSKTLNLFVKKMPTILSNYFLSYNSLSYETDSNNRADDNEFLSFIHLSSSTLYIKMKAVLSIARERKLSPLHVSAMGILLLRCITFSLQRTLGDCAETKMFTKNFCSFVKTVFAILSIAFSDQLGSKFFDSNQCQPRLADFTLRGAFSHLLPILLHHQNNCQLIPFCISVAKNEESKKSAYLMITKLLQTGHHTISTKILDSLSNTNDPIILLEYYDLIPSLVDVPTCEEYEKLNKFRESIENKLGITFKLLKNQIFLIESISKAQSDSGYPLFTTLEKMNNHNAVKLAAKFIKTYPENIFTTLLIFSMSQFIQIPDFSSLILNNLKEMLANDKYTSDGQNKFEIRPVDYALPISLAFISRLLAIPLYNLAEDLLQHTVTALSNDSVPLHMICNLISKHRSLLTPNMCQIFDSAVSHFPCADELYISGDDIQKRIFNISKLLVERDMTLLQNPDTINREYQSPFMHALKFSQCSISFLGLRDDEIANALCSPMYDINKAWKNRSESSFVLAKLASEMDFSISYKFFVNIMEKSIKNISIEVGRMFLMNCKIDVFQSICQNCRSLIHQDQARLDFFLKMFMPCFTRLKGGENIATNLLCGLLDSIHYNSPREIKESVADSVCLIYLKLGLHNSQKIIMRSTNKLDQEIRNLIVAALQIDSIPKQANYEASNNFSHPYFSK